MYVRVCYWFGSSSSSDHHLYSAAMSSRSLEGRQQAASPPSDHIHPLAASDAVVLSACAEFPTFSDALAKVMQMAMPALEGEVWEAYLSGTLCGPRRMSPPPSPPPSFPCEESMSFAVYPEKPAPASRCDVAGVDASICLPAFAWDVERRVPLSVDSACVLRSTGRRSDRDASSWGERPCKARRTESPRKIGAPRAFATLEFFHRLASICQHVSISVTVAAAEHRGDTKPCRDGVVVGWNTNKALFPPLLCFERRWHRGKVVAAAADEQAQRSPCSAEDCDVFLVTRCGVRGLFDNLPLRQAAFKTPRMALSNQSQPRVSLSSSWPAVSSASAQRTRREEQQHLFVVFFQVAACAVLAPLYLYSKPRSPLSEVTGTRNRPSIFVARLLAQWGSDSESTDEGVSGGAAPSKGACSQVPTSTSFSRLCSAVAAAGRAHTDDLLAARSAQRGTREGLHCDRYGLRSGCFVVQQAEEKTAVAARPPAGALQAPSPADAQRREETRGEATARRLCDVFQTSLPSPDNGSVHQRQTSEKWRTLALASSQLDEDALGPLGESSSSSFTEVVVRPGSFAVLFHTPSTPLLSPADHGSPSFSFPSCASDTMSYDHPHCGRHCRPTMCLIIVGCPGASPSPSAASPACRSLPTFCRVLEPEHWAYDVVAATHARLGRRRSSSSSSNTGPLIDAVPVFLFVDVVYVPAHLYEQRLRERGQRGSADVPRTGITSVPSASSFAQLYAEAVERLGAARSAPVTPEEGPVGQPPASASLSPPWQPPPPSCLSFPHERWEDELPLHADAVASTTDKSETSTTAALKGNLMRSSAPTPTATATDTPPCATDKKEVGLRMQYVCQRVLEAAAAPGTQSFLPGPMTATFSSAPLVSAREKRESRSTKTEAQTSLHRVRLTPAVLWRSAMGYGGGVGDCHPSVPFAAAARPRRTPVSLHPKLAEIIKEEKEESAAQAKRASAMMKKASNGEGQTRLAEEELARMRHLLDTGRGSVLRQLPRACNPPQSWTPVEQKGGSLCGHAAAPPIAAGTLASISVVPWARKFILLAQPACDPTTPGPRLNSPRECDGYEKAGKTEGVLSAVLPFDASAASSTTLPAFTVACPRQQRWWLLDQHAVHERVRLEFFLCFADTYVCHPELQETVSQTHHNTSAWKGKKRSGATGAAIAAVLSSHARHALERRQRHMQLLRRLETDGSIALFSNPFSSFTAVIPVAWRVRVSLLEPHLRQWGWRFLRERDPGVCHSPSLHPSPLPTAVQSWPCLVVEGFEHRVASLQGLMDTVEEMEAHGGASVAPSALTAPLVIPSVFLRFFVSRSCRGAVMFGDAVTAAAARHMVAALACVEQYYVCSHGRPSFASLTPFNV